MTTATRPDVAQLEATSEQARVEAARGGTGDYQQWQDVYGAYEVACDDAKAAWTAWAEVTAP
jgi:hypothetical protein